MAGIFYNNPPPQPFLGGRQPLEGRKLPPSLVAVAVNDPPFGPGPRSATLYVIIGIAQAFAAFKVANLALPWAEARDNPPVTLQADILASIVSQHSQADIREQAFIQSGRLFQRKPAIPIEGVATPGGGSGVSSGGGKKLLLLFRRR
jgi:hypothetical protein